MPVRKVGPNSYQWGNSGKVYSGKGAKAKAERQGRAIYASGYKGAAEEYGAESYKPPASAVANAKRGLKLRKEWGRGGLSPSEAKSQGIDSGVTRARKIASGKVSRHDVRRMSAFNRHRKNYRPEKKMPDGGPTAGTIAWLLWGGTSGVNWAKKKSAAMNAESFEAKEEIYVFRDNLNTGYVGKPSQFKTKYGSSDVKELKQIIKQKDDLERVPSLINFELNPKTIKRVISRKTPMPVDFNWTHQWNAETFEAEKDEEELKQYMVSVPALHYYSIGPVEASDEEEAIDDVRNNWRSHWRHTIDDNGDWGGPLWRYSRLSSHDPEAYEVFGSESWGGDPDGPLAKALAKARESLKKPQKPLQITRLPDPNQKTLKDFDAEDGSDSGCYDPDHFDCNSCFEICLDCHPSKIGGQDSIGENLCMDCVAHQMAVKEPCKCDYRRCIECVNCLGCEVQESGEYENICTGCVSLYASESYEDGDFVWVLILDSDRFEDDMGGVFTSKDEAIEVFSDYLRGLGGDPDGIDWDADVMVWMHDEEDDPSLGEHSIRLYQEKLNDPDFSKYYAESYEADWQDLPRNELGQWQKPVSTEQLQNLIATTPGVPKLSDLLMLYGGDTPNNRYRLYNDMLTLRITTEDFDDDTIVIDIDNDPEIYYQYILEEPLDVEEEDDRLTPEYWDRYSRYLAMTNTPDELEARIESLVSDLDLFNDSDFSEIGVMMAALRQQKFMEKYQAE